MAKFMANVEKPQQDKRGFLEFMSVAERRKARDEIAALRDIKSPDWGQRDKLDQLQGMSRRDLLKKVGLAGAGVALGAVALERATRQPDDTSQDQVTSDQAPEPVPAQDEFAIELPEQLEGKQAIQALVENYNRWFFTGNVDEVRSEHGATQRFVEIYEQIRSRVVGMELPPLTAEEFDKPDIFAKLHSVADAMSSENYYVRMMPTSVSGGDRDITYVAITSGKIVSTENTAAARGDKAREYVHTVVDKENPDDSDDRYITAVSNISGMTYQRTAQEPYQVVQMRFQYEKTAQTRYGYVVGNDGSVKAAANRYVFHEYKAVPKDQAVGEITRRVMENSHDHEQQHVLDEYPSDVETASHSQEYLLGRHIIDEMRGLLAGVAAEDPKVGLLNVLMWKETEGSNGTIGTTTEAMLKVTSGYDVVGLLQLPPEKVRSIAAHTLAATDILFEAAERVNFNLSDPSITSADQAMMQTLHSYQR